MYNDRPSITLPCNVMQQTPPPPLQKKTKQTKRKKTKKTNKQHSKQNKNSKYQPNIIR